MDRKEVFDWVLETYGTEPDYPWNDWNAVLRHNDSKKWYGIIIEVPETKLGLKGTRIVDILNVKGDPAMISMLMNKNGYFPAYHMNKGQWISILLDGSVPADEIKNLISMSYNLTMRKSGQKRTGIRKAKQTDIETIMKIWLDSNISAHPFVSITYWENNFQDVKEAILNAEVYVYEKDNCIIGFVGVIENFIAGIFVEKLFQGMGIGTEMIEYLKTIKSELSLNVYVKNQSAVSFYRKRKFVVKEEQLNDDVDEKEYLMCWKDKEQI